MQIIVLGMHRSGTSMLTRIINLMGAYFGPEKMQLGVDSWNPKGYWERKDVVQINEQILSISGSTWYSPNPQDCTAMALPYLLGDAIQGVVLGLEAHRPWVIKDPRLCLTLPFWTQHLDNPVVVFCTRHPQEVAQSLCSRNRMSESYAFALWEFYAISAIKSAYAKPQIHIAYEDFLQNPTTSARLLFEKLLAVGVTGIRMPHDQEIEAFVSTRGALGQRGHHGLLSKSHQHIYEILCGKQPGGLELAPSDQTMSMISHAFGGALFG